MRLLRYGLLFSAMLGVLLTARAEILGMANYETKSAESLKSLKSPIAPPERKEGIAIIDLILILKILAKLSKIFLCRVI